MNYTHHQLTFELDDSWLEEANMQSFTAKSQHFPYAQPKDGRDVYIVDITDIAPCEQRARIKGVFCDNEHLTAKERVMSILRGFRDQSLIAPVEIKRYSRDCAYKYQMQHGSHRLHSSIAVGYTQIPVVFRREKTTELKNKRC